MDNYLSSLGSRGDWREYDADVVKARIRELAGEPNLDKAHKAAGEASDTLPFAMHSLFARLPASLRRKRPLILSAKVEKTKRSRE